MASKTTDWRPGPTVCRCCLSEGCYKDISTEYFWMGKREVYAEMLSETFSLSIAYSQSGGPNSNSRLICEPCISRLRDASDFRRQVQECEKTFTQYLDPVTSVAELDAPMVMPDAQVKVERVKIEKEASDDDFDDRPDFNDHDDDDDDLDDQPLTKLASKVPKKESVDLMDLLDNAKAGEKRKSTTKAKAPAAKKAKGKKEAKATTSKAPKPEKKKKDEDPIYIARRNAEIMVQYTTAYPFRLPECSVVCVYCCQSFADSSQFRRHMEAEHADFPVHAAFAHVPEGYIKVDCTELRCRLCSQPQEKLEVAAAHLVKDHNIGSLNLQFDLGMQPFKLGHDRLQCAICSEKFAGLRTLSRHTQRHFAKFTCESCGKSYPTISSLQAHIRHSHIGNKRLCRKCKRTFKTLEARRKHLTESPQCWSHICRVCGERFVTWNQRLSHQAEVHGKQKRSHVCPECREIFADSYRYRNHFKTCHAVG